MKFSLIICTYKRPEAVRILLDSVQEQKLYPHEILIIDGSPDDLTKSALEHREYPKIKYYKVEEELRGLTKQRNYGISKVASDIEVICFLDDDIVLIPTYFQELTATYKRYPQAVGVGGYINDETEWREKGDGEVEYEEFEFDGWSRKLGSRNVLRKKLRLLSNLPPGHMPEFSNGFSTGFLPPSGKIYPVEFFMGGVASYKKTLFEKIQFSRYFEGYGLYEDMDFCLRASYFGRLYVNTAAIVTHLHDFSGRPNSFKYGKMVLRNGWYVWRVKFQNPSLQARLKWHSTAFLLTLVRAGNILTTSNKREALLDSVGRFAGWWSLLLNSPKVNSASERKEKV